MLTVKKTIDGEDYPATFSKENNGWYVTKNGYNAEYVPYSRIFKIDGIEFMATTPDEALRLGIKMIRLAEDAFTAFEKSHPELNP